MKLNDFFYLTAITCYYSYLLIRNYSTRATDYKIKRFKTKDTFANFLLFLLLLVLFFFFLLSDINKN